MASGEVRLSIGRAKPETDPVCGMKVDPGRAGGGSHEQPETDPVCGMKVDPATARGGSHQHAGKTYWFCNPRCRERFAADPEHWLEKGPSLAAMRAETAAARRGCRRHPGRGPARTAPGRRARRVDLPDGPRGARDEARRLPDLRHGARAARRLGARGARTPSSTT